MQYIITPQLPKESHAGPKAKDDIDYFLSKVGYKSILLPIGRNKYEKLNILLQLPRYFKNIKINDKVVIQYPQHSYVITEKVLKLLKKKKAKIIGIIHDIEGLRQQDDARIKKDLKMFNSMDALIVHTEAMKQWLEMNNIHKPMIILNLFDYHTVNVKKDLKIEPQAKIVFAGNLNKSLFLKKISTISMDLYGPCEFVNELPEQLHYRGVLQPEILPTYLDRYDFGLVWDGESIQEIQGEMGEYLKYNAPHKLSLYLSAGVPVIVWKKSAMASFIEENNIGFTIHSIDEIEHKLETIDYETIKNNVKKIQKNIIQGDFIIQALKKVEKGL